MPCRIRMCVQNLNSITYLEVDQIADGNFDVLRIKLLSLQLKIKAKIEHAFEIKKKNIPREGLCKVIPVEGLYKIASQLGIYNCVKSTFDVFKFQN